MSNITSEVSPKKRGTALMLTIIGFIPPLSGLSRFYLGKIWTGLLFTVTGGLLEVGIIYDLIMFLTNKVTDKEGRKLAE